jgi:hypothetical protein
MRQIIAATIIARKRLEKTQNVALGNIPDGFLGVGVNSVPMMSSCMMPQIRYEICKPKKQHENSAIEA